MKKYRFHIIVSFTFAFIWLLLLSSRLSVPSSQTFYKDPHEYSDAAVHLATQGFYSLDGITPFLEREPGYSGFLALVYTVFGSENRLAIFLMQGVLTLLGAILFTAELKRHVHSARIADCALVLLLILPPVYHTIFSAYRENFALCLLLFFSTIFLRWMRTRSWKDALMAGLLLGWVVLTYLPYIFLPLALVIFLFVMKVRPSQLALIIFVPYVFLGGWGLRNAAATGQFQLSGASRSAIMIHVRGERAEHMRGAEPFLCLWSEYISRNWKHRSSDCSFNAVMHRMLAPEHQPVDMALAARIGRQKILQYLPFYLWDSLFEVLELHLPYVNGWGFAYNALSALAMVVVYVGCLLGLRRIWRPEYALFLLMIGYSTAIFALTDATPRYLLPTIFCYCVLGSVGYEWLFSLRSK